jgi:CheY-like chemotaxis protein
MRRVLVVEDEPIVALAVQQSLLELGCEVGLAGSAESAVAAALASPPDLVLMDIRLEGEGDGILAAERIQRQEAGTSVIFLTAYSDEATLVRAAVLAPAGYLVKPFTGAQVRAAVSVALAVRERDAHQAPPTARRLACGVAHNMNNLLGVVQGHGEMAGKRLAPKDPAQRHLLWMLEASGRGAELARQLLDYAGQRSHLAPVPLDLQVELASLLSELRGVLEPTFPVVANLVSAPPVRADRRALRDVLLAIAYWVRDALAAPGIVEISTPTLPGGAIAVQVRVEAVGADLGVARRRQLFEPFFSLEADHPVAGLGLAAARGLMRQAGGALEADPSPSGGTTFRLEFPAAGPS